MKLRPYSLTVACALIAAIALTTAWKQHLELVDHRARALDSGNHAELERRLREAESRSKRLELQLAAQQRAPAADPATTVAPEAPPRDAGPTTVQRSPLDSPQGQAMRTTQLKSMLDSRYGALFKQMNLPPAQLDKFKALLAERQATLMDVMMAARDQGINPRENPEALRPLLADAQRGVDDSLRTLLGDAAFAEYQSFEQAAPQRRVVSQLEQRLSYTDTPLTSTQADQLVKILAATTPPDFVALPIAPGYGGGSGMGMGFGSGGGGPGATPAPITPAAVAQAQTLLDAKQVGALVELQQQQQVQKSLLRTIEGQSAQPGVGASPTGKPKGG